MRSQTEGRASLITAWFLVRGQVCAKTRVTTLHTRHPPTPLLLPLTLLYSPCQRNLNHNPLRKKNDPKFCCACAALRKGNSLCPRSPRQPPHSRPSHKICEILCKMYNTHGRRGLFRSVQLSATTFVFARRGGAFTVCAHAAVVPASSFP